MKKIFYIYWNFLYYVIGYALYFIFSLFYWIGIPSNYYVHFYYSVIQKLLKNRNRYKN
jgi:hypothetical protein